MNFLLITIITFITISMVDCYMHQSWNSQTALHAHHVQKKIIKRKMDRRPKKLRPSDVTRNNVNLHKCITKVDSAPSEYTIISASDYLGVREKSLQFWESGDSSAEWFEIKEEDMVVTFSQNLEPVGNDLKKKPNLVKSGSC